MILKWVSEWLSLMAFLAYQAPYKLCNNDLYIGIIIFSEIDNTVVSGTNSYDQLGNTKIESLAGT